MTFTFQKFVAPCDSAYHVFVYLGACSLSLLRSTAPTHLFKNSIFSDATLTNDLNTSHHTPLAQALDSHPDEGLLQLEPPLTSSEYSFSMDDHENLHDIFDSLPF